MVPDISKYIICLLGGVILAMSFKIGIDYLSISQLEKDKESLQAVIVGMDSINRADDERAKKNAKRVERVYSDNAKTLKDKLEALQRAMEGAKDEDKCVRASIILDNAGF